MSNKFFSAPAYFVTGALLASATSLHSNSTANDPNRDEINQIVTTVAAAVSNQMIEAQENKQNEFLDALPDALNCESFGWMNTCNEINKQAKLNPSAPLRVLNKNGVEFNFVPGTPSAGIRFQLDPNEKNAQMFAKYISDTAGEYKKVTNYYSDELGLQGQLKNIRSIDQIRIDDNKKLDLPSDIVSVSAFIDSDCGECRVLVSNLKLLKNRHPKMQIGVYMVDNNKDAFDELVTQNGFKGKILTNAETDKVIARGVNEWPSLWLNNSKAGFRDIQTGAKTVSMLERSIIRVSKYDPKADREQN